MIEKILDVNLNWVSLNSFERFVKEDLSKVNSHFTKEDLIHENSQKTILPKLRNMLKFSHLIGIIDTNGKYQKSAHNQVQQYFSYMEENNLSKARELLSVFILNSIHFKEILEFLRSPNVSRRDFIEFLKSKDENNFEESRYKTMAMVLSNMLFELKLINKIRTKGGRIKKQVIRTQTILSDSVIAKPMETSDLTKIEMIDIQSLADLHKKYGKETIKKLNEMLI